MNPEELNYPIIGFSSSDLLVSDFSVQTAIMNFENIGSNAIEFVYYPESIKFLEEVKNLRFKKIKHVSLHAPSLLKEQDKIIANIKKINEIIPLKWVVVHPDEISDLDALKKCELPIAIENMDWNKSFGKDIADLEKIFYDSDFKLIIDLNHCFTNDHTMQLAREMQVRFKERLVGIHISGFVKIHEPLFLTKQEIIIESCPRDVPIIIESFKSPYLKIDSPKKEIEYIKTHLKIKIQ